MIFYQDSYGVARRQVWAERLKSVAIALTATVFCITVIEIFLRVLYPADAFLDPNKDDFWRAQLRHALDVDGHTGWRDIQFDSGLGWRMTSNWTSEGVEHNSLGFRATREYSLEPPGARALFVGDSYTYGLGVSNSETYSAVFEQLTGIESINAGVNGYGADQALLMLRTEGAQYSPSYIVFGYFVDDFNRNGLQIRDGPKPYFELASEGEGQFLLRGTPVLPIEDLIDDGLTDTGLALRFAQLFGQVQRRAYSKLGFFVTSENHRKLAISDHVLREFNDAAQLADAQLLVLVISHCVDGTPENLWIEKRIMHSCEENEINCLNVAEGMRGGNYESYYGDNCHWSADGHRFAAEGIASRLGLVRIP